MARCQDFPCCGHELGCCPDFDEAGRQLNMVCTCGKKLPIDSRYSICESCLNTPGPDDDPAEYDRGDFYDEDSEGFDDEIEYYPEDQHLDGMGEL